MRRNYKILALVLVASLTIWSFIPKQKGDPEKDKLLLELLTFVIEKGHYSPADIDDNFSKSLFKEYIKTLDPTKRFFLQSDIEEFSKYETELDDQIKNKDLTFFDLTYSRLKKRIDESKTYYKSIFISSSCNSYNFNFFLGFFSTMTCIRISSYIFFQNYLQKVI